MPPTPAPARRCGPGDPTKARASTRRRARCTAAWPTGPTARQERIVVVTPGFQLVSLDAKTGQLVDRFGENGIVDLFRQLDNDSGLDPMGRVGNSSPPVISNDVVVVGPASIPGGRVNKANVKLDVMGFDVRTGRSCGRSTPSRAKANRATRRGRTAPPNTPATRACGDRSRLTRSLAYVYLNIESATNDTYGGHRPGNNLYSDSLVALDIKTGKMIWHQQLVHHDIWDYDLPPHPILIDITVDGQQIPAVVQLSKQAFAYVFDRRNGKPVWPLEEKPVTQTDLPGEWTAPTQPFPTKPPAFDLQGVTENDLIDFTPELRAEAIKAIQQFKFGPSTRRGFRV